MLLAIPGAQRPRLDGDLVAQDQDLGGLPRILAGDSRSHLNTCVIRRKTNRRHMIGDHHRRAASTATLLFTALDGIFGTHRVKTVIADMMATRFCDSSGISVLVRAHQQAAANRTQLRLVVHFTVVVCSLRLVQMDYLLPIYPTLSQALAAGPAPAPQTHHQ